MSFGDYSYGDAYRRSQPPQQPVQPTYSQSRTTLVSPSQYQGSSQYHGRPEATSSSSEPYQSLQDRYQYPSSSAYGPVNRSTYDSNAVESLRQAAQYSQASPPPAQHPQRQAVQQHGHIYSGSQDSKVSQAQATSAQNYYGQQQVRPTSTSSVLSNGPTVRPAYQTQTQTQTQTQPQTQGTPTYRQHTGTLRPPRETSQWPPQKGGQVVSSGTNTYVQYSDIRSEGNTQVSAPLNTPAGSTATTVDPSHVYDASHEYRRQAHIAMSKASKLAGEETAVRQSPSQAVPPSRDGTRMATDSTKAIKAKKMRDTGDSAKKRKRSPKKKPEASLKPTGSSQTQMDQSQMQAAARTLMQTANADPAMTSATLEAQMKAMFLKMREFNQQDPDMLSRLWQQEREEHLAKGSEHSPAPTSQTGTIQAQSTESAQVASKQKGPKKIRNKAAITESARINAPAQSTNITPAPTPAAQAVDPAPSTEPSSNHPVKKTIWPANKKATLAQAASSLLIDMAGNNGRTLPVSEILLLLDAGPTYVELCDQIESRGIRVDRSHFAKKLLNSVPDVKTRVSGSHPAETPTDPTSIQEISTRVLANAEKRIMNGAELVRTPGKAGRPRKDGTARGQQGGPTNGEMVSAPDENATRDRLGGQEEVKMYADEKIAGPQTEQQGRPGVKPLKERKTNKGQAARQSSQPGPPTKQDLARKRTFADLIDLTQHEKSDEEDLFFPPIHGQLADESAETSLSMPPVKTDAEHSPHVLHPGQGSWDANLAIPGSTPAHTSLTMPGQPSSIGQPDQPLFPADLGLPLDHPGRKVEMVKALDRSKAIRRSSYDPRTIARDVLIACGRHPEMRRLNAHLESLRTLGAAVEISSDLSTFRWDIVDPGGPVPGSGAPPLPERPVLIDVDADDEDSDNDSVLGGRHSGQRQTIGFGADGSSSLRMAGPMPGLPKAKGRARLSEPSVRSHASRDDPRQRPRGSEGVFAIQAAAPGTPSSYALLRQQQAQSGEPVKKRGRPVGWRKSMMANPASYRGAAANKPAKQKEPSPEPVYQVFKCEWNDCGAELHNLKTLRKHIFKLHGKRGEENQFQCHWKACGRVWSTKDAATGRVQSRVKRLEWPNLEQWKDHVEQKHITPIAWKLGDGPKGGVSDNYESEVSESYMSDSQGRRVTPQVVVPDITMHDARKRTQAEKDAEQTRAEAEARKRDIGPGVDRGGATLVTDKRRQGFVDDEDVMEIVDDDD